MNDNDFMSQPSGVFIGEGEYELTNAGLFIAQWMGFNPKKKAIVQKKKEKSQKEKEVIQNE